MGKSSDSTCTIQVELPVGLVNGQRPTPEALAHELRRLWVLEQLREHRISQGKAAEILGLPLVALLELMGRHHISVFSFTYEELKHELSSFL